MLAASNGREDRPAYAASVCTSSTSSSSVLGDGFAAFLAAVGSPDPHLVAAVDVDVLDRGVVEQPLQPAGAVHAGIDGLAGGVLLRPPPAGSAHCAALLGVFGQRVGDQLAHVLPLGRRVQRTGSHVATTGLLGLQPLPHDAVDASHQCQVDRVSRSGLVIGSPPRARSAAVVSTRWDSIRSHKVVADRSSLEPASRPLGFAPAPAARQLRGRRRQECTASTPGISAADFVHVGCCRRGMPRPAHHSGQHQSFPIETSSTSRERGDERSGVDKGLERGLAHHDRDGRPSRKALAATEPLDPTDVRDHGLLSGDRGPGHVGPQMLDGTGLRRAKETRDDSDAAGQPLCVITQQAARG